jgi:diguanylate cyclase (GGDEF)-like protein
VIEPDKDFAILVVSDNYAGLDILSSMLMSYYNIKTATGINEALTMLIAEDIHLIILDCEIHDKEWYEFMARIKSNEETMKIPVILIGDASQQEYEERGFAMGAVDYISKPFRSSIVKVRVNNQRLIIKQIKAIEELGFLDPLTSIPNRRGFDNRFHLEWLRAVRDKAVLSLLVADIDHFKKYNDNYGHIQGDVLLRAFEKHIASMLKKTADFVARWGGEEFVVMLPRTELKGAIVVAEEIRKSVEEIIIPNLPSTTISVGVASIIPSLTTSRDDFFSKADKALYQAKNSGRNRVCCFS